MLLNLRYKQHKETTKDVSKQSDARHNYMKLDAPSLEKKA